MIVILLEIYLSTPASCIKSTRFLIRRSSLITTWIGWSGWGNTTLLQKHSYFFWWVKSQKPDYPLGPIGFPFIRPGNALVVALEGWVFMGGGNSLPSADLFACWNKTKLTSPAMILCTFARRTKFPFVFINKHRC